MIGDNKLWEQLQRLPREIVERFELEDLLWDGELEQAEAIITTILAARERILPLSVGYHTSGRRYEVGDEISPQDSRGKYRGKSFVSRSLETAFTADHPRFCYLVQACGLKPDPDDFTGKDWSYTISPMKVLKEIPLGEVLRAKRSK